MKLIALCGAPGAGKTAVQNHLCAEYGITPVDDGNCIRDFAMRHLGLSEWHVKTQAGKASMVVLPGGKTMTVREALGEFGNRIEDLFGPDAIPEMALMKLPQRGPFSFGSTRREQGQVYKRAGGVVVEVIRPGFDVINDFDQYDRSVVDYTILNGGGLSSLHAAVDHFARRFRLPRRYTHD